MSVPQYGPGSGNNTASGSWATVAGGLQNTTNTAAGATIAGGQNNTVGTTLHASGNYSTIGGGLQNTASDVGGTVSGGQNNKASRPGATIGGGGQNTASGEFATIGGGYGNTASGSDATVPGGINNVAAGDYSFAAGSYACTQTSGRVGGRREAAVGAFVWADSSVFLPFYSLGNNEFAARATGGVRFVTATDSSGNPTAGVQVSSGGGSWGSISDRNLKENFEDVNGNEVLEKLDRMPLRTWNYKTQHAKIRHLGPMAQDFHSAFRLGEDDLHISTVDADGIAFASIQALYRIVKQQNKRLKQENKTLEKNIKEIHSRITRLEKKVKPTKTR